MQLTVNKSSALRIMRMLRAKGQDLSRLGRTDLLDPSPAPRKRWPQSLLDLSALGLPGPIGPDDPLRIAVSRQEKRLRVRGVRNTVYGRTLPDGSFIEVGGGVCIPCPELVYIEMAMELNPVAQLLLGLELCGTYVPGCDRQLQPATSVARIRRYARAAMAVWGKGQTGLVLDRLLDDARSPMEAILAALATLPAGKVGYGLGEVELNRSIELDVPGLAHKSRIPDILIKGSKIGFNYDGAGHLDIAGVAHAAMDFAANPGDRAGERELEEKLSSVRAKYVDDRRRDRELLAQGYRVLPVIKEDLYERGALDAVMLGAAALIEEETGRDLSELRAVIMDKELAELRQKHVWALLPGEIGRRARSELAALKAMGDFVVIDAELSEEGGEWSAFSHKLEER